MDATVALVAQVAGVLALAAALAWLLRRPRLALECSLRGGTREGTLYVVVTNRGGWARDARIEIWWTGTAGTSRVAQHAIGELPPREPVRIEADELHRLLPEGASGWSEIVVRARARLAFPRTVRLPVAERAAPRRETAETPAPVRYVGAIPCPARTDGAHDLEERPYRNDGVTERWKVCRACRHVEREPLTPHEAEVQARVRAARAERLRREMEAEFARRAAEEEPRRARRPHRSPPPGETDAYPAEVAFFVLELDAASATWKDVLAAHRRLALAHHPDRHATSAPGVRAAAERKMQEINAARDRLREHFGVAAPSE